MRMVQKFAVSSQDRSISTYFALRSNLKELSKHQSKPTRTLNPAHYILYQDETQSNQINVIVIRFRVWNISRRAPKD